MLLMALSSCCMESVVVGVACTNKSKQQVVVVEICKLSRNIFLTLKLLLQRSSTGVAALSHLVIVMSCHVIQSTCN